MSGVNIAITTNESETPGNGRPRLDRRADEL